MSTTAVCDDDKLITASISELSQLKHRHYVTETKQYVLRVHAGKSVNNSSM